MNIRLPKLHLLSLFSPSLAFCGTLAGTVVDLSGVPISGAIVRAGTTSVTTSADGSWSLASSTSITSRRMAARSVTSHLVVENGRVGLSWKECRLDGRRLSALASRAPATSSVATASARAQDLLLDTLGVYWRNRRIAAVPLSANVGTMVFRIDTSWKGDGGIAWNSQIAYGSLRDSRDGQVYRTVEIGGLTWMAENLNYAVDSSWWFKGPDGPNGALFDDSLEHGAKYGRYYPWHVAMGLPDSCRIKACSASARGVCPEGWRIPSRSEWTLLAGDGGLASGVQLRAAGGWGWPHGDSLMVVGNGCDVYGFRAVHAGHAYATTPRRWGDFDGWWQVSEAASKSTSGWTTGGIWFVKLVPQEVDKGDAFPVRCIKNVP